MPERDYSHRSVVDKLGIKPGDAIAFDQAVGPVDAELQNLILERTGRPPADADEPVNIVLVVVDESSDAVAILERWKRSLVPNGGIWLLTSKRGQPGYVDQRELITAGLAAGLVDNKVCSISDRTSAIRFVIRRADRAK